MQHNDADGDWSRRRLGGGDHDVCRSPPRWYDPLGSFDRARMLLDMVAARATNDPSRSLIIDADRGVVTSPDRGWDASLGPLAVLLANARPDEWPKIVDREIQDWERTIGAVRRLRRPCSLPTTVRLSRADCTLGGAVRPAFGTVVWEAVHDLGADGIAAIGGPDGRWFREPSDETWDRAAAATVARNRHRWSHLAVEPQWGVVLGGPQVSALLFDPKTLRAHVEPVVAGGTLAVTVVTNSLMLVVPEDAGRQTELEQLTESLRRFTADQRRRFDPFPIAVDSSSRSDHY